MRILQKTQFRVIVRFHPFVYVCVSTYTHIYTLIFFFFQNKNEFCREVVLPWLIFTVVVLEAVAFSGENRDNLGVGSTIGLACPLL